MTILHLCLMLRKTVAAQLSLTDITEEDVMLVIDKLEICKSHGQIKFILKYLKKLKKQSANHSVRFSICLR